VPPYHSWLAAIKVSAAAAALAVGAAALTVSPAGAATPSASTAGGGWKTVPGPAVAADLSANLTALAMASPSLGWTSGFTTPNNGPLLFEPLLAAWNGRHWSVSTGPHISELNAASFDGRKTVWAVGSESFSEQAFRSVVQVNG
jgi:hypothetical protein